MAETDAQILGRASPENMDPFAYAPPGHSLTQDNSRWPWGKPPRDADPEIAFQKVIDGVEKNKDELMKLMLVGVSVEVVVESILMQGFQEGKFSPDVATMMKPMLGLVIAEMAEDENVPFRMFENEGALDQGKMDDETFFRMMKENNPRMFEQLREGLNKQIRDGLAPREPAERNFLNMEGDE